MFLVKSCKENIEKQLITSLQYQLTVCVFVCVCSNQVN